ncbi:hypothetical protein MKW92_023938 [Papaver armeniacum]|nr:hypothetical protein MKW92_023938 [Papaver armeniacum]
MSFFGIEVTKSKPVTLKVDKAREKLRLTQASLQFVSEYHWRCAVLCSVGGKTPITLCILNGSSNASCPLDIEFNEEDDEVVFSVDQQDYDPEMRVNLTGYYTERCGYGSDQE